MKKLGFIGAGNMATAILGGVIAHDFLQADEITIFDVSAAQSTKVSSRFGVSVADSQDELIDSCECIIMAVKPIFLRDVLLQAQKHAAGKSFISIAAGWTFGMLTEILNADSGAHVLRVMPNTPAMVGEGFTALCEETTLSPEWFAWAKALFDTLGETAVLPERLFDAVVAVSGSSPAYIYMMIEAMADAAVALGMPRAFAYRAAAQATLGSAKMVLKTGDHPAKLKDDVCSPGGTTIDAVHVLEQKGFRAAVMDAMIACAQKSADMAKK